MPMMDDSGIESEDKQSGIFAEVQTNVQFNTTTAVVNVVNTDQHMVDLEVAFRGANAGAGNFLNTPQTSTETEPNDAGIERQQAPPNTCRILQRKLELKVERAKRNYTQYQEDHCKKSQSSNLIPIERLQIPGDLLAKPLVDYKSDSSDDVEENSFFPAKLKHPKMHKNHELTDTFSIQEMTIDSDGESERSGSPSLELLLPNTKYGFMERIRNCFWCTSFC